MNDLKKKARVLVVEELLRPELLDALRRTHHVETFIDYFPSELERQRRQELDAVLLAQMQDSMVRDAIKELLKESRLSTYPIDSTLFDFTFPEQGSTPLSKAAEKVMLEHRRKEKSWSLLGPVTTPKKRAELREKGKKARKTRKKNRRK